MTFSNVLPVGGHKPDGYVVSPLPPDTAPLVHTHTLSDILQSGAAVGEAPLWNGTAWVPGTVAAAGVGGSTGATDNRLLRSDGAGGSTLQNSAVTVDDSGNMTGVGSLTCTAFVLDQTTYSGRTVCRVRADGTDEATILSPSGTGYLSASMPDGTTTGGNQRGIRAVDWQLARLSADQVASGQESAVVGGRGNKASGGYAVAGGDRSTASGTAATCFGLAGYSTGVASFYGGGEGTAGGNYSGAFGWFSSTSASYCFAWGENCYSVAESSGSGGSQARSYLRGMFSQSAGMFGSNGDNQRASIVARVATSNATPATLFLDGSSSRIVVPANSCGVATVRLSARTNTATAQWATGVRQVSWFCGATAGSLVISAIDTIGTDRGSNAGAWPAGWAHAITADTANRALDLQGTGAAATNIRWSAGIEWQEVTFA